MESGLRLLRIPGPVNVAMRPGSPRTWIWWPSWVVIILAGLVLKARQPTTYGFGTSDDDELMVRMAKGFLDGHWSSSWASTGPVTLAKPVGYPLFLAGVHFLPWSPVLSAYLVYLTGASLIAWSWRRISGSRSQATIVLAMLVFNPVFFSTDSQRIYRDTLIDALATLAIGMAFVVAAGLQDRRSVGVDAVHGTKGHHRHSRTTPGPLRRCLPFLLAVLIGLAIGLVAISKPTYQWLVIAVAAPLAFPVVQRLRPSRARLVSILKMGLAVVLVAISGFGVLQATKEMNKRTYHVALVEDLSTGALEHVWKLWASVESGPPERDIIITKGMRTAVYRISPAAAELKPFLESPQDGWKGVDCRSPLRICNDAGNWFEWDLRDTAYASDTPEVSSDSRCISTGSPTTSNAPATTADSAARRVPYWRQGFPD